MSAKIDPKKIKLPEGKPVKKGLDPKAIAVPGGKSGSKIDPKKIKGF